MTNELIEFTQKLAGGRTFEQVIHATFNHDHTQSSTTNKVQKMIKKEIFERVNTGLASPRNALVFAHAAKEYLRIEKGEEPKRGRISATTIRHEIMLQTAAFWLSKIDSLLSIRRAEIIDYKGRGHTPDLDLVIETTSKKQRLWIEVETSHKTSIRYTQIFRNLLAKNGGKIPFSKMIYIAKSDTDLKTIATKIPSQFSDFVSAITIDDLIYNVKNNNKIQAKSIKEFL